jgi:hypothetical protein
MAYGENQEERPDPVSGPLAAQAHAFASPSVSFALAVGAVALTAIYLLLLIPERSSHQAAVESPPVSRKAFAWNQDAYWNALETKYRELRRAGCPGADGDVHDRIEGGRRLLQRIDGQELDLDAPVRLAREAKEGR